MSLVRIEQSGTVRRLTVCRAARKNAISRALADALADAVAAASDDEGTAVVVLAAEGDVFLSGGDLDELLALDLDRSGAERVVALGQRLAAIERCAVPVVAAVTGPVFGGGAELLMMCDQVVMEASATVQFVHARLGLVPAWGGATRLIERVGATRAADLLFGSRSVSAEEARGLGLCVDVVPDGRGTEATALRAADLAGRTRAALVQMKRALLASREARRGNALEAEREAFVATWGSAAHRAAFRRLAERRGARTEPG